MPAPDSLGSLTVLGLFAYGPAPGVELIPYFLGLLAWVGLALGAIILSPLTALLRTGATSVSAMVVVGDTASDVASGLAAGAGLVVGVLTGAHSEKTLTDAGADVVITSVADLPELLEGVVVQVRGDRVRVALSRQGAP